MSTLDDVLADLEAESAQLEALVADLDEDGWRTPTPAEGWDVAHHRSKTFAQLNDDSFDLVISINSIHNLPPDRCKQALREMERVSRAHKFGTIDA